MSAEVVIVHRRMTHYRVPLFELMRSMLAQHDIRLRVLCGDPTESERTKNDSGQLEWAEHLPTRYMVGGKVMWQPFMHLTRQASLVVVPQENKHLHNIPAILNPLRRQRIAFWGHGRNMQGATRDSPRERFKQWMVRQVDWWFTYTDLSRQYVLEAGFPSTRVTVLNNSVDTSSLRASVEQAALQGTPALKSAMGLGPGPLGSFIGSLYPDKRLDFLFAAVDRIRQDIPDFQLAIAGAGPDEAMVRAAVAQRPFAHYLGPLFNEQKARLLAASEAVLNPGLVGLGILDAFVAGLPILTTDCRIHSPEIAYLDDGSNGLMTANNVETYASACVKLIKQPQALTAMKAKALESGLAYSVKNMAGRFCSGIESALAK